MKSTGMYRKVDDLGRIVLPSELRKSLGIGVGDRLAISVDGPQIILARMDDACAICGSTEKLSAVKGRHVCAACRKAVGAIKS
jgi:transcriptional pleiotropic regulator of transition state genes